MNNLKSAVNALKKSKLKSKKKNLMSAREAIINLNNGEKTYITRSSSFSSGYVFGYDNNLSDNNAIKTDKYIKVKDWLQTPVTFYE